MNKSNKYIVDTDIKWEHVNEGMRRKILGYDDQIMMVKIEFLSGGKGDIHSHVHRQCTYIVSGVFEFEINGEKRIVKSGDGLYMEPNVPHGVICMEAGTLIDTFSPVRLDFLN